MDVGHGAIISDKWIPEGENTGIVDIEGNPIFTRNKVEVNGMKADYAYVGRDSTGQLMMFFGREDGASIGWFLTQEVVGKRKIRLYDSKE